MQKSKEKLKYGKKGITLVALVITVIIIIILSTVTINMAFGDNGLITQAQRAKDMTANSIMAEQEEMNSVMSEYLNVMAEDSEIPLPDTRSEIAKARDEETVFGTTVSLKDDSGDIVWIPGEFKVAKDSATDVDEGVVIEDEKGNQFVWIPVADYTTMYIEAEGTILSGNEVGVAVTTDVYSNIRMRPGDVGTAGLPNSTLQREPDVLPDQSYGRGDASTVEGTGIDQIKNVLGISGSTNEEILNNYAQSLVDEYTATYESIKKYDGFYVGRYELGGTVDNPAVSKGVALTNVNWYSLKKACTNLENTKFVQSTMIYGNQWDEIMAWLKATCFKDDTSKVDSDSRSWGNYSDSQGDSAVEGYGSKQITGYSEYWKANNIYDLAGNCWERTQEASGIYNRVYMRRSL